MTFSFTSAHQVIEESGVIFVSLSLNLRPYFDKDELSQCFRPTSIKR